MIFNNKNAILDVNSESACLMVLDGKSSNNFVYQKTQKHYGYQEGIFFDLEEFKHTINSLFSECYQKTKIRIKQLLVSVPNDFTTIKIKTIENSLGTEARTITIQDLDALSEIGNTFNTNRKYKCVNSTPISFNTDTKYHIFSPIGLRSSQITADIAYVLAERAYVEIFEEVALEYKFKVEFTSTIVNEAIFILKEEQRDIGSYILDFDYLNCSLSYVRGDGIISCKTFPIGYGIMAGAISTILEVPLEQSLELFTNANLFLDPKEDDCYSIVTNGEVRNYSINVINDIIGSTLMELAESVRKEADKIGEKGGTVYIIGRGINKVNGAIETLSEVSGMKYEYITDKILNFVFPENVGIFALWQVANRLQREPAIKKVINWLQEEVFKNGKQRNAK